MEFQSSPISISVEFARAFLQPVWINTDTANQHIYPLICGKELPSLEKTISIEVCYLYRTQILDEESIVIFLYLVIGQSNLCPNTTLQKLFIFLIKAWINGNSFRCEVLHLCPVSLLAFNILHMYLIDKLMSFLLFNDSLGLV